jgi:hypothetical protein
MSNITPEMTLYVESSGTPIYSVDVTLPSNSGFEISMHGDIPEEGNPENQIHVDVHLLSNTGGSEAIQIGLGELSIDQEGGEVHINLIDEELQKKGGGIIKTEEATEDSK